ncbi:autotransporter outer membrane beta-barrel domain-containing protein [Kaistia terrae]|nr:autotransporter outer membrane beta-barrel domain-containing protein [Kaistia terrae]
MSDVNVGLGASYTWNEIERTRHVSLSGFFETEKADYSAGTTQIFGEVGYDVAVSAATTIEPFAGRDRRL